MRNSGAEDLGRSRGSAILRVLQVHASYRQPGGEDTVVATERTLLESSGHEVRSHIEHNPESVTGSLANLAVSPWNVRAAERVVRAAQEFQPDVVHIHNTWFRLSPTVVREVHRVGYPTVVSMHNYRVACLNAQLYRDEAPCEDCVGRIPWRGVTRRCYRSSALQSAMVGTTVMLHRSMGTWDAHADVVVALSDFAVERFLASGVPADRIVVKENTVEDPGPRQKPPSEGEFVLYAGRLSEEKGVLDLLEAWNLADPSGVELVIAGSGPLEARIRHSLPRGARMIGQVPDQEVRSLLLRTRALAFPSRLYEGQPMVLLEALSAGAPAIYPDLGAIPEVVGGAGWPFRAGDTEGLSHRLETLHDASAVDSVGESARRRFELRFSPEVGIAGLEDVYRRAVAVHESRA